MDLNAFAAEIHQNAIEKGFFSEPLDLSYELMMIHSELSEAAEEYRAGRPGVWHECLACLMSEKPIVCESCESCYYNQPSIDPAACTDRSMKPEGIYVELLDVVMRILDLMYHMGMKIYGAPFINKWSEGKKDLGVQEVICYAHLGVSTAYGIVGIDNVLHEKDKILFMDYLCTTVLQILSWLQANDVDWESLLNEKHAYNLTRPRLHGKVR